MRRLETERLVLRPLEEGDLDNLWALSSDPEVVRYLSSGVLGREETAIRLRRMMDHWLAHGYGIWAVLRKADRQFIGRCGIATVHDDLEHELVYTLGRAYWGHGYATEAARAAIEHGFTQLKFPRVIALAVAENLASRNVMRKVGMTFEKVIPFLGHEALRHRLDNPYTLS
jgi:ribosomal-protein-alanine N-acetyltransferase